MKIKRLVIIVALALPGAASAQHGSMPQSTAPHATIIRSAEIRAVVDRTNTGALSDAVLSVVPIESKYNVAVAIVRRSEIGGHPPAEAIVHHDVTEVYQIIEGRGILVTGGKLQSGKPITDPQLLRAIGPTSIGKGIIGGTRTAVGPGDMVVVPPNTPHGFVRISTRRIVYTIVRVDPHRVLSLPGNPH